jgi:hypothetical protein
MVVLKEDGRVRRPVHPQKVMTGSLAWLAPASLTSSLHLIHLSPYIYIYLLHLDTKFDPHASPALDQKLLTKAIPTDLNDLEQV